MHGASSEDFAEFCARAEPLLRRALVAGYGVERGLEATAESLAYAWEHWERVRSMENAIGYLYRVGQSRSRARRVGLSFPPVPPEVPAWIEPHLPDALTALSERERLAVVLIEGFGWTHREVAEMAGVSVSSVQSYLSRGLRKLRRRLGVTEDV